MAITPDIAWEPLSLNEWSEDAARHLLRRVQWTATPEEVQRAFTEGLPATLDRMFPSKGPLFKEDDALAEMGEEKTKIQSERAEADTEMDKRKLRKELRKAAKTAMVDMSMDWLGYASNPKNAAFAKWVLFLSDIYVVAYNKVKKPDSIYTHFDIISRNALGPAPVLTKAISRSPAMVNYLDLNKSNKKSPNENFARELMELFVLGEGNYTEHDVKEAARAFTGYRQRKNVGTVVIIPNQHDLGNKTVFGKTGRFNGDNVIDLAYQLPAAGAFLPHEMIKFYLSDTMIDHSYLDSLGQKWRKANYSLRWIAKTFFGSKLFFEEKYRGNFVKSPIQFYLGLLQDLKLNVLPVPRFVITPFKQMGQVLFDPPNVRGWVGGFQWINSTSLAARRNMVEGLFTPFYEAGLNEDEKRAIASARAQGEAVFKVDSSLLENISKNKPQDIAQMLVKQFLCISPKTSYIEAIQAYLVGHDTRHAEYERRIKRAMITIFASAEYQLT